MEEWWFGFWKKHGERLIFLVLSCGFAIPFMLSENDKLVGSGITILIGNAMLMFNKTRSPEQPKE